MSINVQDPSEIIGATVYGPDNDKIGTVDTVFLDNQTGQVAWAAVKTGMFGMNVSLVPLNDATFSEGDLHVPYSKDQIKDAPNHDADQPLSESDEDELYRHYQIDGGQQYAGGQTDVDMDAQTGVEGQDTSGPNTDNAMTRSEERLNVGTEQVEAGRARLRKYIVTENVTQTVPVSHDEIVVEREPITDANRGDAMSGGELTEEEHEVVLTAEQAVVQKETVPVERVRLGTETVTGEQEVNAEVRKEEIETVTDGDDRTQRPAQQ
ncbi:PRC and DUF2382 domain-containing protein [Nakamurella sp. A5-74]|uniref:PRC and DUF2382 domain-containing protein n=1 Tax=Nakamurella sp. A5-74 TaxID=3158264 RepID=A0AAU8DRG7_9ACTN